MYVCMYVCMSVCMSLLAFLPFTQKIFKQPIPQNLWSYAIFFCGCPYEKKKFQGLFGRLSWETVKCLEAIILWGTRKLRTVVLWLRGSKVFGSITGLFGTVHTGLRSLILFAPRQSVQLTSAWRARAGGNRFWLPGCRRGRYSVSLFSASALPPCF